MLKKTIALTVAAFMFVAVAVPAQAQSIESLQAMIAQLQAQIAAMSGGSSTTTTSTTFTRDLTIGSTGADVIALQDILIAKGHLVMPAGVAKGYFGTLTQSAVAKWQAAEGISPAAGYFGAISRAKVAGSTTPTTPTTPTTTTTLEGTNGEISDVNELSQYNNEDAGEGEEDVVVAGFEVEASNDGDIAINSIKVSFDSTGNTGSDNLDDYIDGVSIWMGDKKIGSADVEDIDEDSNDLYTKVISVGKVVVKADETEKFYISVDVANNLDSGDLSGDSWTVDVENIRFTDGEGVVTTDDSTGDIDGMDVGIDFVTFSTAADTELKISLDSESPEEGVIIIDDEDNTDDVVLLKGKLRVDGDSDVVIDEFPVTFTTVGGASLSAVTGSVKLTIDGEDYTESVSSSLTTAGTITFDNLDFTIEAGDSVEFEVSADINDIDAGNLDEGDTLKAEVTSTNRDYIDVENEEGDQLDDSSEKSGTALGDAQEFRTEGIQVTFVSATTDATTGTSVNDDIGLFTIKFRVKAVGDAVYLSSLSTSVGYTYAVDKSGTATTANSITATIVNDDDDDLTSVGNYKIEEDEEETIIMSVSVPLGTGGTSGQYRTALTGIKWDTDDDATPDNTYSSDLDKFKTAYKVLN